MGDIGQEIPLPADQAVTKQEKSPNSKMSWEEIRAMQLNSPFSETLKAFFERSKQWKSKPGQQISEQDWRSATAQQVTVANDMLQNYHNPDVKMTKTGKVFAGGIARPEIGQQVMTRLYLGVDPRHAADAFKVLIDEFSKAGCARDIDVAFNEEEVVAGKIIDNMIVIYEPLSRPDVLNKILSGYYTAKNEHPDVFNLTPLQREAVMRSALIRDKAIVDANLSFVEMDPEDGGASWDSGEVTEIHSAFGINYAANIATGKTLADEEWLRKVQTAEAKKIVILTKKSRKALESGDVKSGDQLEYKRKLSAPALIQRGVIIAK